MTFLTDLNARNRAGAPVAVASVCSAQPDVLFATLKLVREMNRPVLIEATSNQVNQFGGYTGMRPADFLRFVQLLVAETGTDPNLVHFGGDHLGTQAWRNEPAEIAMAKAEDLVRAYVEAGFCKIHLDCSEGCAGEPAQVDDKTSALRAARLAAVCEAHAPDPSRVHYVVGTEVPPPGGARGDHIGNGILPTEPDSARHTLAQHRRAFEEAGIPDAWRRVIGLVVQPGLEFAPTHVDHFDMAAPNLLSQALSEEPLVCFEAHSTDYQTAAVFPELARRNFSVLKVGPALTFAYRQALYSLDHLRALLRPDGDGLGLFGRMEAIMQDKPDLWLRHCTGSEQDLRLQRHFSYADRIRYFWPDPSAQSAVKDLFVDLGTWRPPRPVLQQCFDFDVVERAEMMQTAASSWPRALVLAQIQMALRPYFF